MTLTTVSASGPACPARTRSAPSRSHVVTESALSRFRAWLRHAPAERLPLPADPGRVDGRRDHARRRACPACTRGRPRRRGDRGGGWIGERRSRDPGRAAAARRRGRGGHRRGRRVGDRRDRLGPAGRAGSPDEPACTWPRPAAGTGGCAGHEAVRAARARRDEAAACRVSARRPGTGSRRSLGLHGSHLLEYDETLLGDTMLIDTRGTGKRASQVSARDVAERLGELEMIPAGRIDVTPTGYRAGCGSPSAATTRGQHALHPPRHRPRLPVCPVHAGDPATCRKPAGDRR